VYRNGLRRPAVVALRRITFDVGAGEIVCLVGAGGAGKTTMLRLAAGLLTPRAGQVRVGGEPADGRVARRLAGFAPRDPVFPPAFTVREVLAYCAGSHAARRRERQGLVREVVELLGLAPIMGRRAAMLGLADGRRVLLAQAALGGRHLLLLDEPFAGIDAITRRALGDCLQHLVLSGASVLLSSADPIGLERLADRVAVLNAGRLTRVAPATELLGGRVLEVVLDAPPRQLPPGFRLTATGMEADLGPRSAEAALALCRAHRLTIRASRVRLKTLDEAALEPDVAAR
jgi:ABC-2 type transport system ATP-binding protein